MKILTVNTEKNTETISWMDKVTNENLQRKVNEDKQILNATETTSDGSHFENDGLVAYYTKS